MEQARAASKRSTCFRLNVGALIVFKSTPVSMGYNGAPPGKAHCSGNDCPGKAGCYQSVHAERNAHDRLDKSFFLPVECDLYVTHSPCVDCAPLAAEFNRVFFEAEFRDTSHLHDLARQTALYIVTPAGYVIEWVTKNVVELA
jgi:dCMP deaminase